MSQSLKLNQKYTKTWRLRGVMCGRYHVLTSHDINSKQMKYMKYPICDGPLNIMVFGGWGLLTIKLEVGPDWRFLLSPFWRVSIYFLFVLWSIHRNTVVICDNDHWWHLQAPGHSVCARPTITDDGQLAAASCGYIGLGDYYKIKIVWFTVSGGCLAWPGAYSWEATALSRNDRRSQPGT